METLVNLEAEQRRRLMTDADVAKLLGIKRETYCKKKKTFNFKYKEIVTLCDEFQCDFEYLFKIRSARITA